MGEDDRPPLSRRVPDENRGHKPAARIGVRQLPDEVVARMRAAVEAGAAAEARDAEAKPDRGAAIGVMTPPGGVPVAPEPERPAPESPGRASHKGPSARGSRKRAGHVAGPAEAKPGPAAGPAASDPAPAASPPVAADSAQAAEPGRAAASSPRRARRGEGGAPAISQPEQVSLWSAPLRPRSPEPEAEADTEQFAAIRPSSAVSERSAPAASNVPPVPASPPPADPRGPERPPLPASTIRPAAAGRLKTTVASRRYRVAAVAAVVAVVVLAGSLTLAFWQSPVTTKHGHTGTGGAAAEARSNAAAWIANQVSPTVLISCDLAMCRALAADGFPPDDTRPLSRGGSPLGSALVVATAAVRANLGSRLSAVDAPAVMARFGAGASRVDVRVVAPHGAAAFESALSADLTERKQSGSEFLASPLVGISSRAWGPIEAGHVDSRLLIMLTDLEVERAIQVVSFGDAGPGASLDASPFRSAVVGQVPTEAQLPGAHFVAEMLSYLRAQHLPQFEVASAREVRLPGGKLGVRIEFAAPEPLGLLNGGSLPAGG